MDSETTAPPTETIKRASVTEEIDRLLKEAEGNLEEAKAHLENAKAEVAAAQETYNTEERVVNALRATVDRLGQKFPLTPGESVFDPVVDNIKKGKEAFGANDVMYVMPDSDSTLTHWMEYALLDGPRTAAGIQDFLIEAKGYTTVPPTAQTLKALLSRHKTRFERAGDKFTALYYPGTDAKK